jgi:hypothetical protein
MLALTQGHLRRPILGVKVLEEMPFDILINNCRNQKFPVKWNPYRQGTVLFR